jgi:hypothetical protein
MGITWKKLSVWTETNILQWSPSKLWSVWDLSINYFLLHLLFVSIYWEHNFLNDWSCASMMMRSWLYWDELYTNGLCILPIEDLFFAYMSLAFGVSCIESWGVSALLANTAVERVAGKSERTICLGASWWSRRRGKEETCSGHVRKRGSKKNLAATWFGREI